MRFEVSIPAHEGHPEAQEIVEAPHWRAALREALTRRGEPTGALRGMVIDIQEGQVIHLTDAASLRTFTLRPAADPAAQPAAPTPAPQEGARRTMILHHLVPPAELNAALEQVAQTPDTPATEPVAVTTPMSAPEQVTAPTPEREPVSTPLPTPERVPMPAPETATAPADVHTKATVPDPLPALGALPPLSDDWFKRLDALPPEPSAKPAPLWSAPEPPAQPTPEPPPEPRPAPVSFVDFIDDASPAEAPPAPETPAPSAPAPPRAEEVAPAPVAAAAPPEPTPEPARPERVQLAEAAIRAAAPNASATTLMPLIEIEHLDMRQGPARRSPSAERPRPPARITQSAREKAHIGQRSVSEDVEVLNNEIKAHKRKSTSTMKIVRPEQIKNRPQAVADTTIEDIFLEIPDLFERPMEIEDATDFVLDLAMDKIKAESGAILFASPDGAELYFAAARGPRAAEIMTQRMPINQGIAGFCTRKGLSLMVDDVTEEPRYDPTIAQAVGLTTTSLLCVPIQFEGRSYGCIELLNHTRSKVFTHSQLDALGYIGYQFAQFVQRYLFNNS